VDKTKSYLILNLAVHILTTVLYRVKRKKKTRQKEEKPILLLSFLMLPIFITEVFGNPAIVITSDEGF